MKKLLFSALIGAFASFSVYAQCVPDTTIQGVVVPPAGSNIDPVAQTVVLPYAYVSQNYSEVIHFKVPKDTTFPGLGSIPINHVKLDGIIGLPAAFTLSCTPTNCLFPGDSYGCAEMTGIPTMADSIALRVAIEYNITISGLPTPIKDTLDGYYLVVKGSQNVSLNENKVVNHNPRIFPNPASKRVFVDFESRQGKVVRLQISSVIGTLVSDRSYPSKSGDNQLEINVADFKPGIYMYSLEVDDKSYAGRFTISR